MLVHRTIYRITKVECVSTVNRDRWLEWRNERKTLPTSSTICSYFGYGYTSWNNILLERINPEKIDVSNFMKSRAINHGTTQEEPAKEFFKKYLQFLEKNEGHFYKETASGEISTHYEVSHGKEKASLISTPDFIYLYSHGEFGCGKAIAEFKAPFYCMLGRRDKSVLQVIKEFIISHPEGKENAFLQAASYSLVENAHRFCTVFYFTDFSDETYIVIYNYHPTPELYDKVFTATIQNQKALVELSEGSKLKYRSPNHCKSDIFAIMKLCLEDVIIYDGSGYILKDEIIQ